MRMAVGQQRVRMLVRVCRAAVPFEIVGVLVVLVMDVAMRMLYGLMRMHVLMPLLQM